MSRMGYQIQKPGIPLGYCQKLLISSPGISFLFESNILFNFSPCELGSTALILSSPPNIPDVSNISRIDNRRNSRVGPPRSTAPSDFPMSSANFTESFLQGIKLGLASLVKASFKQCFLLTFIMFFIACGSLSRTTATWSARISCNISP